MRLNIMSSTAKRSRKHIPWQDNEQFTPTQAFLAKHYIEHYNQRHPKLTETGESELINSFIPLKCPICGSESFKKRGRTRNGIQRFQCICGKTFTPVTGTIFEGHKVSISEWMEFCLNLFRHLSINADSWNNKNAYTTSQYWLKKIFLILEDYQNDIILKDMVWLDETTYRYRIDDDRRYSASGTVTPNQLCIGVALDNEHLICLFEGCGRTSASKTVKTFIDHISPGATLIHDGEYSHNDLVKELELKSETHTIKETKGLADKDNPLNPVNQAHNKLKKFLNSHSGFNRDDLQNYLNLFAFANNPPSDPLEKVELLLQMAFLQKKTLKYRDLFKNSANASNV